MYVWQNEINKPREEQKQAESEIEIPKWDKRCEIIN